VSAGLEIDRFTPALDRFGFFVCVADLEDELIRALGVDAVLAPLDRQGELRSFEILGKQPQHAGRPIDQLLRCATGPCWSRRSIPRAPLARCIASSMPFPTRGTSPVPPRPAGYRGLMRIPSVPGPGDVLAIVNQLSALPGQLQRLVSDVDGLLERIENTRAVADDVVAGVDETRARADGLVAGAEKSLTRLVGLLDSLEPSLTALQPTLERLADTTDPREVDALVSLVDQLPQLATQVERDVLPVLTTLGSVAPDLHDLLDVSRELNEMLAKLPGLGRIRRRVEEQQAAEAARTDDPQSA